MQRAARKSFALAVVLGLGIAGLVVPACASLGEGEGRISGTLNVPNCWSGRFDLAPDFFAGVPYRDSVQLRIQRGGDFETFSDGVHILVDDVHAIRPDRGPGLLGKPLKVSLPPAVTPPGVPVEADPDPASVHLTLYLQRTCRTQNVALYAVANATLNPDGTCEEYDSGAPTRGPAGPCQGAPPPPPVADGGTDGGAEDAGTVAPGPVGHSTMTFTNLYNAVPEETKAAERLTQADFDVYLVDPREICPGGLGPPPRCRGHLTGSFRFYFQRGRPAQPFP